MMGYRFKQTSFLDLANISRNNTSFTIIATFLAQFMHFSNLNTIISTFKNSTYFSKRRRTLSLTAPILARTAPICRTISNIQAFLATQPFSLALGSDVYESADISHLPPLSLCNPYRLAFLMKLILCYPLMSKFLDLRPLGGAERQNKSRIRVFIFD